LNANAIALFTLIFFVVSFVSLSTHNDFAVLWMGGPVFDSDYDGFVHFVADD
jgi:hypothetical protein